ncbi:MAG: DNA primase [Bacteroidales bacterium]|nr:DNA primase [Bacteroidales bacterium]
MIPNQTVDRILETAKIEEVIGDFVSLKRQGASFLACCPFHNEKTPSFNVNPVRGFFYCFGCKKGGTAVTFLMEHEKMSFTEAIRYLAKKYGIEIEEQEESPEMILSRQKRESLYIVSEFAQKWFAEQLEEGEGRAVGWNYFRHRGLQEDTIRKFGLGWCPSGKLTFHDAAIAAGYKEEYLIESGLCVKTEDGKIYDRFHERVIFPIHSVSGRVCGFSGRTLKDSKKTSKYINSPNTQIYDKSRTLYGMWFAKQAVTKEDCCILVEGNLDMISLHQLGLTNVVATCGTSLTREQILAIKRFTRNVTIMYDGDSAGIHAAIRGIDLFLKEDLNVKVVLLPEGMDPDDFTKKHSLEETKAFIAENAQDFIGFKTKLLLDECGTDPMKRSELINDIADTIALMPDPVKRSVYADSCSERLDISVDILKNRIEETAERNARDDRRREELRRRELERAEAEKADSKGAGPDTAAGKLETVVMDGAVGKKLVRKASILEPVEKDLLAFLLRDGLSTMNFTKDSEYYMEPPMTVAEFIDGSLHDDGLQLEEGVRRRTYEAYFKYYDEGLDQDEIIRKMTGTDDNELVNLVVELTSSRYELNGEQLRKNLTNHSTLLLRTVPKAILLYHAKRLDKQLEEYRQKLNEPGADIRTIMMEITHLNEMRRAVNRRIGRI